MLITVFGGHASPYNPATKGLTPNTSHSKQPPNPCSFTKIPTHSDWSCLSIFNITPSDSLKKSIADAYECMLIKRENHGRWEKGKKEKVLTLEFGGILLTAVVAGKWPSMSQSNYASQWVELCMRNSLHVSEARYYANEWWSMIFNHLASKHTCDSVLEDSYRGRGSPSTLSSAREHSFCLSLLWPIMAPGFPESCSNSSV